MQLYNSRIIAFYSVLPHVKKGSIKKPQDLFELPIDIEFRRQRIKKLKRIEVKKIST